MVMYLDDAFDVLGGDDSGLTSLFVDEDAAEVSDPIADNDIEAERTPILLHHRMEDAVADVVVIGRRIGHMPAKGSDGLKHIGARDDADDRFAAHHRQALHAFRLHQVDDVGQWHILRHGEWFRRHDLRYLAAMLGDKIPGRGAWPKDGAEPATSPALSADLTSAEEVALGNDADELAGRIDDRQPAHVVSQHDVGGLENCRFRCDGDDRLGHDLVSAHG
jgi:hypothetical protein